MGDAMYKDITKRQVIVVTVLFVTVMATSYVTGQMLHRKAAAHGIECNLKAIFTCGLAEALHNKEKQQHDTFAFRV